FGVAEKHVSCRVADLRHSDVGTDASPAKCHSWSENTVFKRQLRQAAAVVGRRATPVGAEAAANCSGEQLRPKPNVVYQRSNKVKLRCAYKVCEGDADCLLLALTAAASTCSALKNAHHGI